MGHPIIRAFIRERSTKTEGSREVSRLSCDRKISVLAHQHDHRGGTWFDRENRVIWLLAYGRHRSGAEDDFFPYCREVDGRDLLLPVEEDYGALFSDRGERFAYAIRIEAPMLLKKARATGEDVSAMIGGRHGIVVGVEVDSGIEATTVSFLETPPRYEELLAILAAFHPGGIGTDWELAYEMPSRPLKENEVVYRHHHEL